MSHCHIARLYMCRDRAYIYDIYSDGGDVTPTARGAFRCKINDT